VSGLNNKKLLDHIITGNRVRLGEEFKEQIKKICAKKVEEAKKAYSAKKYVVDEDSFGMSDPEYDETIDYREPALRKEENLEEAPRIKIIRIRIRRGKIQRRKRLSNVKGYTLRGGRLVRMSSAERRARKMGARKAVRKRKSKRSRTRMALKRSLRKRKALGLRA